MSINSNTFWQHRWDLLPSHQGGQGTAAPLAEVLLEALLRCLSKGRAPLGLRSCGTFLTLLQHLLTCTQGSAASVKQLESHSWSPQWETEKCAHCGTPTINYVRINIHKVPQRAETSKYGKLNDLNCWLDWFCGKSCWNGVLPGFCWIQLRKDGLAGGCILRYEGWWEQGD